jgi:hypothetical protein
MEKKYNEKMGWVSSFDIASGYGLNDLGSILGKVKKFFSSEPPDRFWGPLSFLFSEGQGIFPRGKAAGA